MTAVEAAPQLVRRPASRRRILLLALAGLALVAVAAAFRLRAGDRDAQLATMTTDELAAMAHLYPDDAAAHYHLAQRLAAETRFAAAKNEYEAAVRLEPNSVRARLGLGMALGGMSRTSEATAALEEAVRLNPRSAAAQFALGKALRTQGRVDEALDHLRKAAELEPNNDRAWYDCATYCMSTTQTVEAADCLKRAIAIRGDVGAYHRTYGELLARLGDVAGAMKEYDRALQIDPNDAEACALTGKLLVTNPPDADSGKRAETLLLRASKSTTAHPADVWFDLGQLYLSNGRVAEAVDALERAVQTDPRDERFYYSLAAACRRAGETQKAKAADAAFQRISALHGKMDHLGDVVDHNPRDLASLLGLARTTRDLGLFAAAVKHYQNYLSASPSDNVARRELDEIKNGSVVGPSIPPALLPTGSR